MSKKESPAFRRAASAYRPDMTPEQLARAAKIPLRLALIVVRKLERTK